MATKVETKRNFLNQAQTVKLSRYFEGRRADLVRSCPFMHVLADEATLAMGFPVTVANARSMLETLEIEPKRAPADKSPELRLALQLVIRELVDLHKAVHKSNIVPEGLSRANAMLSQVGQMTLLEG